MCRARRWVQSQSRLVGAARANYGVTVKLVALVPVPPGVVTAIGPVTAPVGTSASTCVSWITWKLVAATPPNVTFVAPVKLCPVIATDVPTGPLVGLKLAMEGTTEKAVGLVAIPPGVVMVILPVFAPAGTVAVTWVSELTVKLAGLPPMVTFVV